mmetsp:Transcript_11876/g.34066  ORF Transcript_11876/g.34066 Transcript_11876/m.34066 type:complete len:344 (+) Transcript_11876:93-1124(+)
MRPFIPASLLLVSFSAERCAAFSTFAGTQRTTHLSSLVVALRSVSDDSIAENNTDNNTDSSTDSSTSSDEYGIPAIDRRKLFSTAIATSLATMAGTVGLPDPSYALVKGVAPPPKKSASSDKPKCTNVEECQALAEQRATEERAREESGPPPLVTKGGVKYRDLEVGTIALDPETGADVSTSAKEGDDVSVYFKVLKLGKRSYDGLSGEGTVVFSRGYGLEDDETKSGEKSFRTTVGAFQNIAALNEALVGMKPNGLRRFAILPQKGWEKATAACDGGPGGGGAGGEIRTDYVVVPTATMVQQEACFDTNKLPFPSTYAQQRRMAQRFDQSLIMEVQLVSINK